MPDSPHNKELALEAIRLLTEYLGKHQDSAKLYEISRCYYDVHGEFLRVEIPIEEFYK